MREDLYAGIMPFSNMERYVNIQVTEGSAVAVRAAVADAFAREDGYGGVGDSVADFIRRAAQTAVFYGVAYYEVSFLGLAPAHKPPRSRRDLIGDALRFKVSSIMAETVWDAFGFSFQIAFGERRRPHPLIFLDRSRTFRIGLPHVSRGAWKKIIAALIELDRASLTVRGPDAKGVDFKVALSWLQRSSLLVTEKIPWVHTGLNTDGMPEMHFVYRWLRMRKFMYLLRENIIDAMNRILVVAGEAKGFRAEIALRNLHNSDEIDQTIQALLAGRIGPEAIDPYLKSE